MCSGLPSNSPLLGSRRGSHSSRWKSASQRTRRYQSARLLPVQHSQPQASRTGCCTGCAQWSPSEWTHRRQRGCTSGRSRPGPHTALLDLYEQLAGEGASVIGAHRVHGGGGLNVVERLAPRARAAGRHTLLRRAEDLLAVVADESRARDAPEIIARLAVGDDLSHNAQRLVSLL